MDGQSTAQIILKNFKECKNKMREIRESTTHCNEKDGYITPAHYYGKNYQMIEIIQDQLTPDGVRVYCKGIALKYLYGINGDNALRRLTKAKYYLDELVNYLKRIEKVDEKTLKPIYYKKGDIETIDIIDDALDESEKDGFYIGMILRYIHREKSKTKLEDLMKSQYYIDRYLKILKERGSNEIKETKN